MYVHSWSKDALFSEQSHGLEREINLVYVKVYVHTTPNVNRLNVCLFVKIGVDWLIDKICCQRQGKGIGNNGRLGGKRLIFSFSILSDTR